MAQHRGADLVIIDDVWGSNLAKARGLTVMSTARLSLEMVIVGGLTEDQVHSLIAQQTAGRTFGLLGEPRVNVLALNLALDNLGK